MELVNDLDLTLKNRIYKVEIGEDGFPFIKDWPITTLEHKGNTIDVGFGRMPVKIISMRGSEVLGGKDNKQYTPDYGEAQRRCYLACKDKIVEIEGMKGNYDKMIDKLNEIIAGLKA